jgi:hypothetical protein
MPLNRELWRLSVASHDLKGRRITMYRRERCVMIVLNLRRYTRIRWQGTRACLLLPNGKGHENSTDEGQADDGTGDTNACPRTCR